jgi:hypothetical protein
MIYLHQHQVKNYQYVQTGLTRQPGIHESCYEWQPPGDVPPEPPPVEFPPGTPEEEPFNPEVEPPPAPEEIPDKTGDQGE